MLFPLIQHLRQPCFCGIERTGDRIIGGTVAEQARYPWMTGVVSFDSEGHPAFCGGSLINDRFVLTAAHCVTDVPLSRLKVVLGAYTLDEVLSLPSNPIIEVITPEFNMDSGQNDIALLKLENRMHFRKNGPFSPICLSSHPGPYDNLFLTGWGKTDASFNNGQFSPVLKEIALNQIDDLTCAIKWREFNPSNEVCAGESGWSPCQGDSGGPLSSRLNGRVFQVGIVSFGDKYCGLGTDVPTIYTKISYFNQLIHSTIDFHDVKDGIESKWCH